MNLHKAVIAGDENRVSRLLWAGVDPNIRSPEGLMILQHASAWKHPRISSLLLEHRADMKALSAEGFPGIYYAIKHATNLGMLVNLYGRHSDQVLAGGNTLMHLLAGRVFGGNGVGAMDVLRSGHVDLYARNDEGLTALEIAEGVRNRACIEFLQKHARWEFADAVSRNNITKVKKMIADGADVNQCDRGERPALALASLNSSGTEMFELLLNHGADTNVRIFKQPLLHVVATHSDQVDGRWSIDLTKKRLELMWDAGADFHVLNGDGKDAVARAGDYERGEQTEEIMELLRGYQKIERN